jgi:MATE family multidrug resistance protein
VLKTLLFPGDRKIFKAVWLLAFPVIISNLSRVIMSLVDVAMVGHLGPEALAATGMGGMLAWGALSIVLGIRTSVQTITSRRLGQNKKKECIKALNNGLLLASIYSIPVSIIGWVYGYLIIPFFISDSTTIPIAISYLSISSAGVFFNAISFVFQGFYTGIEKTKVHLSVTITSNIINAYLNAGLIYGKVEIKNLLEIDVDSFFDLSNLWFWADFDGMGVTGAAIGTLISSAWMMFHYSYYLKKQKIIKENRGVLNVGFDIEMLKQQIKLSLPMGSQEMMIAIGYSFFYKIMSIIGIIELATTQLLFTIMHASFMPAMGVGQACATLVGKYMGSKEIEKSEQSIKESLRIAEYIMGTMGILFILFPKFILLLFTSDPNIIQLGVWGLRLIGFLQFIDAICFTLFLALTGAGNTLFPALVESSLIWGFMLPVSYYAGVMLGGGFKSPFIAFAIYLFLMAIILSLKMKKGDWKEIEV